MVNSKLTLFFLLILPTHGVSQIFPHQEYPELFHAVQTQKVFADSKTFPDCIPLISADKIDSCFKSEMSITGFKLNDFVETYFIEPSNAPAAYKSDTTLDVSRHINLLWQELTVQVEKDTGSLLAVPFTYVVPGGRFQELYYWDSYFTMLGLAESGRTESVEFLVKNFAWLIDNYGFIPNGNRTYYLSRSQPPFFSLMVKLLADIKGDSILVEYRPHLVKEYVFWMKGFEQLTHEHNAIRRVVLLPEGYFLNRYWDDIAAPRAEAYKEDLQYARYSPLPDSVDYRNIRAACESGWDFSSRWMKNDTIFETTEILPVDLNCLLFHLELTISEAYNIQGDRNNSKIYETLAKERKKAINKYFWRKDEQYYVDYNFEMEIQKPAEHLAGTFPLFFEIASKGHAKDVAGFIESKLLRLGGLLTTLNNSGEQWDAPNGWAPLQFISIEGLKNYEYTELADTICSRWIRLNTKTFKENGKLVEKYNVANPGQKAGGGEYPNQDGFGWTNGVLQYLISNK